MTMKKILWIVASKWSVQVNYSFVATEFMCMMPNTKEVHGITQAVKNKSSVVNLFIHMQHI